MTPTQPNTQDALRRLLDAIDDACDYYRREARHIPPAFQGVLSLLPECHAVLAASPKNDSAQDSERLDWLDAQTEKLNSYWGTTYGWRFEANHNGNRLTLSDNNIPVLSVRAAIDAAMATKEAK